MKPSVGFAGSKPVRSWACCPLLAGHWAQGYFHVSRYGWSAGRATLATLPFGSAASSFTLQQVFFFREVTPVCLLWSHSRVKEKLSKRMQVWVALLSWCIRRAHSHQHRASHFLKCSTKANPWSQSLIRLLPALVSWSLSADVTRSVERPVGAQAARAPHRAVCYGNEAPFIQGSQSAF